MEIRTNKHKTASVVTAPIHAGEVATSTAKEYSAHWGSSVGTGATIKESITRARDGVGNILQDSSYLTILSLSEKGLFRNIKETRSGVRSSTPNADALNSGDIPQNKEEVRSNPLERTETVYKQVDEIVDRIALDDSVLKMGAVVCPLNIVFSVSGGTTTSTSKLIGGGYITESVYKQPTVIDCRIRVDRKPEETPEIYAKALSFHNENSNEIREMGAIIAQIKEQQTPILIVNPFLNELGIQYAIITRYRISPTPGSNLFELSFSLQEVDLRTVTLFVEE